MSPGMCPSLRGSSDHAFWQALLRCAISLQWQLSVWGCQPHEEQNSHGDSSEDKPLLRTNHRSKYLLIKY